MTKLEKRIIQLLTILEKKKLLKQLLPFKNFPDEPQLYKYGTVLSTPKHFRAGIDYQPDGYGYSFVSPQLALIRTLGESIERIALVQPNSKNRFKASYNSLKVPAVDPLIYNIDPKLRQAPITWCLGHNLRTSKKTLLPAQNIFLNFHPPLNEQFITESNTMGAAGGFDRESALLRATYEFIERDALMVNYLLQIPSPKINLELVKNEQVQTILNLAKRYQFVLQVFDITNNLKIPTFLSVLIDYTGLAPSLTFGLKSSLNIETALLGSMEESFHTRIYVRQASIVRGNLNFNFDLTKETALLYRGLNWASLKSLKNLDYLMKQDAQELKYKKFRLNPSQELNKVIDLLYQSKHEIYYIDLSIPAFKKVGYLVYKVIIPTLQQMYLNENRKQINKSRLEEVGKFFNVDGTKLNAVPHPFL